MEKEKADALNKAIKASFGAKFEIARKNAGFSRAKLGEVIGVSGKTIQSWENGRTWPENMSLIPNIERILGIFIPKILGETVREEVAKITKSDPPKASVETTVEETKEEAIVEETKEEVAAEETKEEAIVEEKVEEETEEKKIVRKAAPIASSEEVIKESDSKEEIDEV